MSVTFGRKDYGRIFVERQEDIPKVIEVIKTMDEFESSYLPNDFIVPFTDDYIYRRATSENKIDLGVKTVYTHKFDSLDLNELTLRCWLKGIKIFCWVGRGYDYEHDSGF